MTPEAVRHAGRPNPVGNLGWPGLYVGGAGIDLSWGRIIELASGPGRRGNVAQR